MQPELIALTGNQGSGKDTVADYLCSRYGYVKLTYSDGIYEEVTSLTGVPSEVLRVREWKENAWALLNPMLSSSYPWLDRVEYFFKLKGKSPRKWLQDVGGSARQKNPSIWRDRLNLKRKQLRSQGIYKVVVSDVRHENEYRYMKSEGALIARITRSEADLKAAEVNDQHVSEQWVKDSKDIPSIMVVSNNKNDGGASAASQINREMIRLRRKQQ